MFIEIEIKEQFLLSITILTIPTSEMTSTHLLEEGGPVTRAISEQKQTPILKRDLFTDLTQDY